MLPVDNFGTVEWAQINSKPLIYWWVWFQLFLTIIDFREHKEVLYDGMVVRAETVLVQTFLCAICILSQYLC